ncbi:universal stress protein [Acidihalobacter ferrooxydans]|uniref:UspA domain-containing protein n=1 Tax=Acidihalobacter ferrooxydans TaxID=1765967 RepID=A0A1P8UIN0_9GAMM|nr:universal stress protein [Acidihalobacter ferrooxydans]APZ43682.1 hypothetical protein BW247_11765 [Acidihalobacter ferrooxydans]
MSLYHRIIVPMDDSLAAHAGLRAAIDLAQDQQAALKIIAVVDEASEGYSGGELGWIPPAEMNSEMESGARQLLQEAEQRAVAAGLSPESELIVAPDGHVARHIGAAATAWQADLIVLGTHGRHGFSRWLLGSTTENLLRGLAIALHIVPCTQAESART